MKKKKTIKKKKWFKKTKKNKKKQNNNNFEKIKNKKIQKPKKVFFKIKLEKQHTDAKKPIVQGIQQEASQAAMAPKEGAQLRYDADRDTIRWPGHRLAKADDVGESSRSSIGLLRPRCGAPDNPATGARAKHSGTPKTALRARRAPEAKASCGVAPPRVARLPRVPRQVSRKTELTLSSHPPKRRCPNPIRCRPIEAVGSQMMGKASRSMSSSRIIPGVQSVSIFDRSA